MAVIRRGGKPQPCRCSRGGPKIRAGQRLMRTRPRSSGSRILDSVDTVANAFIVAIPMIRPLQLASIPGVVRVYPVRAVQAESGPRAASTTVFRGVHRWACQRRKGDEIATSIPASICSTRDFRSSLPIRPDFPREQHHRSGFTNQSHCAKLCRPFQTLRHHPRDRWTWHANRHERGRDQHGPAGTISGVAPKAWLGSL